MGTGTVGVSGVHDDGVSHIAPPSPPQLDPFYSQGLVSSYSTFLTYHTEEPHIEEEKLPLNGSGHYFEWSYSSN